MKGWKTVAFAVLLGALGAVQQADLATIIPEQYVGAAVSVIGLIVAFLRKKTDTPLGKKE